MLTGLAWYIIIHVYHTAGYRETCRSKGYYCDISVFNTPIFSSGFLEGFMSSSIFFPPQRSHQLDDAGGDAGFKIWRLGQLDDPSKLGGAVMAPYPQKLICEGHRLSIRSYKTLLCH